MNASSSFTATLRELADLTEVRGSAPVAADLGEAGHARLQRLAIRNFDLVDRGAFVELGECGLEALEFGVLGL